MHSGTLQFCRDTHVRWARVYCVSTVGRDDVKHQQQGKPADGPTEAEAVYVAPIPPSGG